MSIISAIILDLDCLFRQKKDIPQIFYKIHFQCNPITAGDKFQQLSYQHFQLHCPTQSEKLEPWIDSNPNLLFFIAACCWMYGPWLPLAIIQIFYVQLLSSLSKEEPEAFTILLKAPTPHQPPPLLTYHMERKNSLLSMSYSTCTASCLSLPS